MNLTNEERKTFLKNIKVGDKVGIMKFGGILKKNILYYEIGTVERLTPTGCKIIVDGEEIYNLKRIHPIDEFLKEVNKNYNLKLNFYKMILDNKIFNMDYTNFLTENIPLATELLQKLIDIKIKDNF